VERDNGLAGAVPARFRAFRWSLDYADGMNVADIPFNRFLGLRLNGSVLTLPADPKYQNHIGAVHASPKISVFRLRCDELSVGPWQFSGKMVQIRGARAAEDPGLLSAEEITKVFCVGTVRISDSLPCEGAALAWNIEAFGLAYRQLAKRRPASGRCHPTKIFPGSEEVF
jgi:hypothetical protein